jgi:hypothetical protein
MISETTPQMRALLFTALLFFWLIFIAFATAAFAGSAEPSQGFLGIRIIEKFAELLQVHPVEATTLYTGLLVLLRVILKKAPVRKKSVIGRLFWKIAEILFGDGVVIEHNQNIEEVKARMRKKLAPAAFDEAMAAFDKSFNLGDK